MRLISAVWGFPSFFIIHIRDTKPLSTIFSCFSCIRQTAKGRRNCVKLSVKIFTFETAGKRLISRRIWNYYTSRVVKIVILRKCANFVKKYYQSVLYKKIFEWYRNKCVFLNTFGVRKFSTYKTMQDTNLCTQNLTI